MSEHSDAVVIAGIARTPLADFQGALQSLSATELGAVAIKAAVARAGVPVDRIDEVFMGCILTAGLGQGPARQAALKAELPVSVAATTVNKLCGSGMQAIILAHDLIKAGSAEIIVAGGMESMSNAPFLLPKVRQGLRIGHSEVIDHMLFDGLEDPQQQRLMGCFAEDCAEKFRFDRSRQDDFAKESLLQAQAAIAKGYFSAEIAQVTVEIGNRIHNVSTDEHPLVVDIDKISRLNPVFKADGTVTPANSSSIADGAAALVLMSEASAQRYGVEPLARIVGHQRHAQQPAWFTTAPIAAIEQVLAKTGLAIADIDLFEINEAFAVVVLAAIQALVLPKDKVNVHGGACALGHPIGASGARIVVTLLAAMQQHDCRRGLASLCIGGGEATAMVLER